MDKHKDKDKEFAGMFIRWYHKIEWDNLGAWEKVSDRLRVLVPIHDCWVMHIGREPDGYGESKIQYEGVLKALKGNPELKKELEELMFKYV